MEEEYTGSYTLVHPDLADDPAQKQGQIGIITYAEPEQDNFYVSFGKSQPALYSADALLVLQKHQNIHANAVANFRELSTDDFRTLLKISLAQQSGQLNQLRHALEMAATNPVTREYSLVNLDQKYMITAKIEAENERVLLLKEMRSQDTTADLETAPAYNANRGSISR
jgi:hypothetical protein